MLWLLGVGINLLLYVVCQLCELGLEDMLSVLVICIFVLVYYNWFGQLIWYELCGLVVGYDWLQFFIYCGEFQMVLVDFVIEWFGVDCICLGYSFEVV